MKHSAWTILLSDDHTIVREGLANILKTESGFQIVGEAANGREAIKKAEKLQPDIIIMDISMPQLNGVDAARQIRKLSPQTKIVILSMHSNERFISELFHIGISGYLLKDSSGKDIVKAIESAMNGDTFLSPAISRQMVEEYIHMKESKSSEEDLYNHLSNREREVFQLIAEGRPNREIAEILCVSVSTVKTHKANIMQKLKMDNISQLIQFAINLGLVAIRT